MFSVFLQRVYLLVFILLLPAICVAADSKGVKASEGSSAKEALLLPSGANASAGVEGKVDLSPDIIISNATEGLLKSIKGAEQSEKTIQFYYDLVDEKVSPIVDFPLIARRVMGRYYRLASAEDRERFVVTFKESLLKTYAKGIAGYTNETLVFLPFKGVQSRKGKLKAKVEMEIRSPSEPPILVAYQMFQNKQKEWKLENIVLNGINLGLTFRNQFSESYKANAGDFSKVIGQWNDVDTK